LISLSGTSYITTDFADASGTFIEKYEKNGKSRCFCRRNVDPRTRRGSAGARAPGRAGGRAAVVVVVVAGDRCCLGRSDFGDYTEEHGIWLV